MRACFVLDGNLNSVWQESLTKIGKSEIIVFGFNGLGLVSYKKELAGETEYFHDVASLSKQTDGVVICACDTDTYGVFRHSAVIADKGKLLGVTDMAHSLDDSEFVPGGNLRVYDTSAGKIGVIIAEDLYFPETARVLTLCDADLIVCLFKTMENFMPQIMLRALSFANGVSMSLVAKNYACITDIKGEVKFAGSKNLMKTEIKIERDYRLISSRRRGLYRDFNSGY